MITNSFHILFLTSWYPTRVKPTLGDFIQRHAEAVSDLHRVSVIHVIMDPNLSSKIEFDIKKEKNLETYIGYIPTHVSFIRKIFLYFRAYRSLLKQVGAFDLIHVNKLYPIGIIALYFNFLKNKKYIISEHWSGYQKPLCDKIGFLEKFLSIIITKKATFVCPVSQNLAIDMQGFGLKGNYKSVPNVVDTKLFLPIHHVKKRLNFIHISSLDDHVKNIRGILRVLSQYKKVQAEFLCYFIGGKKDLFEAELNNLNLTEDEVKFIDHLPQAAMRLFLQRADLLLMFSHYENLPCVILEAFSCGIPVISTRVGGISEYFPDNFGRLISPKNESELLEQLEKFDRRSFANKEEMHQYATDHFSKLKIAHDFHQLYIQTLC